MIKNEVEEFDIFEDNVIEFVLEGREKLKEYVDIVVIEKDNIVNVLKRIKIVGVVLKRVCDKIEEVW